jgi:hypothetical protein
VLVMGSAVHHYIVGAGSPLCALCRSEPLNGTTANFNRIDQNLLEYLYSGAALI